MTLLYFYPAERDAMTTLPTHKMPLQPQPMLCGKSQPTGWDSPPPLRMELVCGQVVVGNNDQTQPVRFQHLHDWNSIIYSNQRSG